MNEPKSSRQQRVSNRIKHKKKQITDEPDVSVVWKNMIALCQDEGFLSDQGLLRLIQHAQIRTSQDLLHAVLERCACTPETIYRIYAQAHDVPFVDLQWYQVDMKLMKMLMLEVWLESQMYPIELVGNELHVAVADPVSSANIVREIQLKTGYKIHIYVAVPSQIEKKITSAAIDEEGLRKKINTLLQQQGDVSHMSNELASQLVGVAVQLRASDIHIEPLGSQYRVRMRVDGDLVEMTMLTHEIAVQLINVYKVMAKMDIAERRLPQDGRIDFKLRSAQVDLRLSTVPSSGGEKMVLRILDKTLVGLNIDSLGLSPHLIEPMKGVINRPNGILCVTGPTGSGKTTTLYACLGELAKSTRNITTIEDPIEYRIGGITQIQVNTKIDLDFPAILRACLRQDPDILLVGEIRDEETAQVAIQASLTGHLVVATVHTKDAPSVVTRLMDLGVSGYNLAHGLLGSISQRLVRRICPHCKESVLMDERIRNMLGFEQEITTWRGTGCKSCHNTGYIGRLPIMEIMTMTPAVREQVTMQAKLSAVVDAAAEEGYRPMLQDGLVKVLSGETTIDEVLRVVAL